MQNLELVRIKSRTDCNGLNAFDIVTVDGGFDVCTDIGTYDTARALAESIDTLMLYEREHGYNSLQTV